MAPRVPEPGEGPTRPRQGNRGSGPGAVVDDIWAGLWNGLDRDGDPPDLDQVLAGIADRGLVALSDDESCAIHPGIADAGRAQAGGPFREVVDTAAAAHWTLEYAHAVGEEGDGTVDTRLFVHAALAAVPYMIRLEELDDAAFLIERAFDRDPSRANAAAALPAIQRIAAHDPLHADVLAMVLEVIDYLAGDVAGIAASYHNHGITVRVWAHRPGQALTSQLAAALIGALTGAGDIHGSLSAAADNLRDFGEYMVPPRDIAHLCYRLSEISGTDLPGLIARLSPGPEAAEQALREIIAKVRELAAAASGQR